MNLQIDAKPIYSQGSDQLHNIIHICISMDKNHLDCYQFSTYITGKLDRTP